MSPSGCGSALERLRGRARASSVASASVAAGATSAASSAVSVLSSLSGPTPSSSAMKRSASFGTEKAPTLKRGRASTDLGTAASATTTSRSSQADDDENGDQATDIGKLCGACWRQFGIDCSYLTPLQNLAWLGGKGAGAYCRDCGNVFRLVHKSSMTLALFERWLTEHLNRLSFLKHLISWLSLKHEGIAHVTLQTLLAREKTLQYVADLMQVPFPCFEVVEAAGEFWVGFKREAAGHYLTKTSDGSVLGLRPAVPTAPPKTSTRYVTAVQAQRTWPLQAWSSTTSSFAEVWGEHVGAASYQHNMTIEDDAADDDEPKPGNAPPTVQSVLVSRVASLAESTRLLMASFCSRPELCKAKDFSPLLSKILKLKQDALESPHGDAVGRLGNMARDLTATKKLILPFLSYIKSGRRSILEGMRDSLNTTYDYAQGHDLEMGITFWAAWVKANYFQKAESDVQAAAVFLETTTPNPSALKAPFSEACGLGSITLQCVGSSILDSLRGALPEGDEAWDALKQNLLRDADCFLDVTRAVQQKADVGELVNILSAYRTIVAAAVSDQEAAPAEVTSAKNLVATNPLAAPIKEGLGFAGVGAGLTVASDSCVVKGAMDDQCDEDWHLIIQTAFNDEMPVLSADLKTTVGAPMLKILDDGRNHMIGFIVYTAAGMTGLLRQWSRKRVWEEVDSVGALLEHIAVVISTFDSARLMDVAEAWGSWRVLAIGHIESGAQWPPAEAERPPSSMPNEECMAKLEDALGPFLQEVLKLAKAKATIVDLVEEVRAALLEYHANYKVRELVWRESEAAWHSTKFTFTSSEDMVAEYCADDSADGLLKCVVTSLQCRAALSKEGRTPAIRPQLVIMDGEEALSVGDEIEQFWALMDNDAVCEHLSEKYLSPAVDASGAHFVSKLALWKGVNAGMAPEAWDVPGDSAVKVFLKFAGDPVALNPELRTLVDGKTFDLAAEDGEEVVQLVLNTLGVAKSRRGLRQVLEAWASSGGANLHVAALVKEGEKCSAGGLLLMIDGLALLEQALQVCLFVADWMLTLSAQTAKRVAGAHREFPFVGAALHEVTDIVLQRWPALHKELSAQDGIERAAFSTTEMSAAMVQLALCVPRLAALAKVRITESIECQTEVLLGYVPRWDHIVGKKHYNPQMAKKQLLGNPIRGKLGGYISDNGIYKESAEMMYLQLNGVLSAFGCGGKEEGWESMLPSAFSQAETSLGVAERTMTILASINVAEEFKNSEKGRSMAAVLLSKSSAQIPEGLRKVLEQMSSECAKPQPVAT